MRLQRFSDFTGVGLVLLRNGDDMNLGRGEPRWEFPCKVFDEDTTKAFH